MWSTNSQLLVVVLLTATHLVHSFVVLNNTTLPQYLDLSATGNNATTHRPITRSDNSTRVVIVPLHRNNRTTPESDRVTVFRNRTLAEIPDGICYREVATASLVFDDVHVVGNGVCNVKYRRMVPSANIINMLSHHSAQSKPTLSRVQHCCDGFRTHPHMPMKCQPVCTAGCTNGICVAPDKCRCLPDHMELLSSGVCTRTCPIGECASNVLISRIFGVFL